MKQSKPHFHNKRFSHPEHASPLVGHADILKWQLTRKTTPWPKWVENRLTPSIEASVHHRLKITYINHATTLIQVAGLNILTDPIWSKRASPSRWIGPSRVHAPGIDFKDLPPIHLVLISHDHFDHLDLPTVRRLEKRFQPKFMVGLKMGQYLTRISRAIDCTELDWWQEATYGNLRIHYTPARHWSSRSPFVKNSTLWGGFVIESEHGSIYFAGDTAFGSHFGEIQEAFGQFKLSLLPIGSYAPRWFMQHVHMDAEEAVSAFKILRTEHAMGVHFDCFKHLADEPYGAAKRELLTALEKNGIDPNTFTIPEPGQELLL